jgi:predicted dehydrogenase
MAEAMNVGIIGCGNISAAYMRMASVFADYRVIACADLNADAATARAAEFDLEARSIDALLASDDIACIVNLTIPAAHFEVSKRILEAGKHVYSEKPFILSLEEGSELGQIAMANGLRIGSAPDTFLGGAHQQARAIIDAGDVGKITSGTCHVMGPGMEDWHPNPDFFFLPGAGPVLDIGPYYVTNLIQLIGPITSVMAMSNTPQTDRTIGNGPRLGETVPVETPTTLHAILRFASGAVVTLGTSWDVWANNHANMELYGENGSLFVPDPNFFGGDLQVSDKGDINNVIQPPHPFSVVNDGDMANWRGSGLADMCQAIRQDRPHRCSDALALHAVEVMTGIITAAENGSQVSMKTTCDRPAPMTADAAQALLA